MGTLATKYYVTNLMIFLRLFLVTLLLEISSYFTFTALAHGQVIGQDLLAAQHPQFNGTKILPFLQSGSALGVLANTFGNDITPVRNLLSSGKFSYVRVHLANGPGIANRQSGPYEFFYKETFASLESKILKKDKATLQYFRDSSAKYCVLRTEFPATTLLISPVLEHRLGTGAFRIIANEVLSGCPGVQLVNNPVTGKGERYLGAWIEAHATSVKADIYSWDGLDASDGDVPRWLKQVSGAKIAFVWSRSFNGRASGGTFVDPRARKNFPSEQTFELLAHITDDRGPIPTPTFQRTFKLFKAPSIFKTLAEDYSGVNDARANLPVAILPFAKSDVSVRGINGTSIGNMKYYGSYQGALNRYYSGTGLKLSGYQMESAVKAKDGSPYSYLCQGKVCFGPIIAGRRGGLMR